MHSNSRQSDNHVVIVLITTEILDLSSPKYVERKKTYIKAGFTEAQMNEKPTKLAAMQSLILRLSGRKDEDIPSAKGVCIPNGFIRDDGSQHVEKITFQYENDDFILFFLQIINTLVQMTPFLTAARKQPETG